MEYCLLTSPTIYYTNLLPNYREEIKKTVRIIVLFKIEWDKQSLGQVVLERVALTLENVIKGDKKYDIIENFLLKTTELAMLHADKLIGGGGNLEGVKKYDAYLLTSALSNLVHIEKNENGTVNSLRIIVPLVTGGQFVKIINDKSNFNSFIKTPSLDKLYRILNGKTQVIEEEEVKEEPKNILSNHMTDAIKNTIKRM